MKKIVFICLGIGMFGVIASADLTNTINLSGSSVTEDTFVDLSDENFGSATYLKGGHYNAGYPKFRTLIKFDLSGLPSGATITSATLSLHRHDDIVQRGAVGSANSENSVYRGLNAWTEGATWSTKDGSTSWNGSSGPSEDGVDFASTATDTQIFTLGTDDWMDFTVTNDIQLIVDGATNYGWLVRTQERDPNQDGAWYAGSSEGDAANNPKLVISYVIPGATNVVLSGSSVTEDTFMEAHGPDNNYGSATYLKNGYYSDSYPRSRTLVKFDLSSLPSGAIIYSAMLSLYRTDDVVQKNVVGSANSENSVYRGLANWTEGATWNTRDGSTSWNGSSGPSADDVDFIVAASDTRTFVLGVDGWMNFTVTSDVQLFMDGTTNYGWLVRTKERNNSQDGLWYAGSSEGGAAYYPKLSINYYLPAKGTLIIIN